jgi:hypothetical protein
MSALRGRTHNLPHEEQLRRRPAGAAAAAKTPGPPAAPKDVPPPSIQDALKFGAAASVRSGGHIAELLDLVRRRERNPELRTLVFNGANEIYQLEDLARGFKAKSVTIYNPNPQTLYVGFAGDSATPLANALPVFQYATFPLQAVDLKLGFQPSDLGSAQATVFLFRWPTLRPFAAE